jgi:AbrB family looped-hinge helix DNA binding protein
MTTTARLSSKGQITIPKKFRDNMGLDRGDEVLIMEENGNLILRKVTLDDIREKAMENYEKGNTLTEEEVFEGLL